MIRAVLFDKDGTLLDFQATWGEANRLAARAVLELSQADVGESELLVAGGMDLTTGRFEAEGVLACGTTIDIASIWQPLLGDVTADRLVETLESTFNAAVAAAPKPVAALDSTLEVLRGRGLQLGVATMDSLAIAEAHLAHLQIADAFCFVCGHDSGFGVKPETGMFRAFCEAAGVPASDVAMVGDTPHDLRMGRNGGAGLVVGVLTGAGVRGELAEDADIVLPDIGCLPSHLD